MFCAPLSNKNVNNVSEIHLNKFPYSQVAERCWLFISCAVFYCFILSDIYLYLALLLSINQKYWLLDLLTLAFIRFPQRGCIKHLCL